MSSGLFWCDECKEWKAASCISCQPDKPIALTFECGHSTIWDENTRIMKARQKEWERVFEVSLVGLEQSDVTFYDNLDNFSSSIRKTIEQYLGPIGNYNGFTVTHPYKARVSVREGAVLIERIDKQ